MQHNETISNLQSAYANLNKRHQFFPGQLVEWKLGLQNRNCPGPFIVIKVLEVPIIDNDGLANSGSPFFREELDIVMGSIASKEDNKEEFLEYYYDSRRLQPIQN